VLPSYSENFGNVVLEAMAVGRPVVVTPEVGVADLVRETGAGVVTAASPELLGSALTSLMTDVARGNLLGDRGRAAARRLSWDSVAWQMETLYQALIERTPC
jgi:glycosyltransferase involved in cell wall biosynthesis